MSLEAALGFSREAIPPGGSMFEIWVSVALLGLWSSIGVIYRNSKKTSDQMDEIVRLLERIAAD